MTLKIKAAVAAVAMALAGAGNAAINAGAGDPNGSSLGFFAYSSTAAGGPGLSSFIDLGFDLDSFASFATSLNGSAVWNFQNNTFAVNGSPTALGTGETAGWNAAWTAFQANAQVTAGNTNFAVFGVNTDNNGAGYTNAQTTPAAPYATAIGNLSNNVFGSLLGVPAANTAGIAGATNASSGLTYAGQANGGFAGGQLSALSYSIMNAAGSTTPVAFGYNPADANANASFTTLGTFAFNFTNDTLTFTALAVPEPSTYALMLAGLGAAGLIARRRISRAA